MLLADSKSKNILDCQREALHTKVFRHLMVSKSKSDCERSTLALRGVIL